MKKPRKKLSPSPLRMRPGVLGKPDDWWYYEERQGLCVVREGAGIAYIPSRAVCDYVDTLRRIRAREKRKRQRAEALR